GRHDADDSVRQAVQVDGTTKNAGISTEALEPKAVAKNDFKFVTGLFFLRSEGTANKRRNTEGREKTGGSLDAIKTNRVAETGEIERVGFEGADALEADGLTAESDEVALTPGEIVAEVGDGPCPPGHNDAVGSRISEGLEENGIDDTENG